MRAFFDIDRSTTDAVTTNSHKEEGPAMANATPPDTKKEMETVTSADGTEIAFERTGRGPPLVLVHGSGVSDHRRWEIAGVRPALAEQVTVYAIDRRGRGMSEDADTYSLEREVEDVLAVVRAIGEPVVLLGHSYGANIALEASLMTDAISGLILYEPAIAVGDHEMSDPDVVARMSSLLEDGHREDALVVFFREIAGFTSDDLDVFRADPSWDDRIAGVHTLPREEHAIGAHELRPDRCSDMTAPTLLLSGGESPERYRDATQAVDDALPNSRLVIFEGQQHVAMNNEPERFVYEVCSFVEDIA